MTKKSRTERLTHAQEIELTRALTVYADNGDDRLYKRTLDHLVTANLGLVNKIVSKFPLKNANCSSDDLFQEGVAGLIHGIQKFDPAKGYRLSTYVYNWISVYVRRYFQNQGRTVRVPIHMADKQYKLNRQIEELTEKLGRTPTAEEVSQLNGKADHILAAMRPTASLNAMVGEDSELSSLIGEDRTEEFDTQHDATSLLKKVKPLVSARDFEMVLHRYGFLGLQALTLSECAEKYDVTRARVHQIEKSVLNKMRELAG